METGEIITKGVRQSHNTELMSSVYVAIPSSSQPAPEITLTHLLHTQPQNTPWSDLLPALMTPEKLHSRNQYPTTKE